MVYKLLFFLLIITSVYSLKCYLEGTGSLKTPTTNSNVSECIGGSQSCIKLVDYTLGTYAKGCSAQNCTMPNSTSQTGPAACYNTTKLNAAPGEQVHSTQSCCCYGDGCNSSGSYSIIISLMVAAITLVLIQ